MSNLLPVSEVFERSAARYDLMNDVMSSGLHRLWKKELTDKIPRSAKRLADIAGGTGDIAFSALAKNKNLRAFCCDPNREMLAVARKNLNKQPAHIKNNFHLIQTDGIALPLKDDAVDCCTISFGIRNIKDRPAALKEMFRILKWGGKFLCLEFNSQIASPLNPLYKIYLNKIIPMFAQALMGDKKPYEYLAQTIQEFPSSEAFAAQIKEAGFSKIRLTRLTAGVVIIYTAYKI